MEKLQQPIAPLEEQPLIVLLRGPSGAGKSALAENLQQGLAAEGITSASLKKDDAIQTAAEQRFEPGNQWVGYTPFRGYGTTAVNELLNANIKSQLEGPEPPRVLLVEGGARTRRDMIATLAGTQLTARHVVLDLKLPVRTTWDRIMQRRRDHPNRVDDRLALALCKISAQYLRPLLTEFPKPGDADVISLDAQQTTEAVADSALQAIVACLRRDGEPTATEQEAAWPHTHHMAGRMAMAVIKPAARRQLGIPLNPDRRRQAIMRDINGPGTEFLADKYSFVELVHKLGYRAPRQILIRKDETPAQHTEAVQASFGHSPDTQRLICKPRDGAGGRRIVEFFAADVAQGVRALKGDYIVQEHIPHGFEVRYVRWLRDGNTPYRVCFEKTIPKLHGDGQRPKLQLILNSDLSAGSKVATIKQNVGSLSNVVPRGGSIHISNIGKGEQKTPMWAPENSQRLENIDRFMQQFLADLQTFVGHPLPMLCFDIGFADPAVLDRPYNFQQLRDNAIFFECQMPFTMTNYVRESQKLAANKPLIK